jgi:hypothetical protein
MCRWNFRVAGGGRGGDEERRGEQDRQFHDDDVAGANWRRK